MCNRLGSQRRHREQKDAHGAESARLTPPFCSASRGVSRTASRCCGVRRTSRQAPANLVRPCSRSSCRSRPACGAGGRRADPLSAGAPLGSLGAAQAPALVGLLRRQRAGANDRDRLSEGLGAESSRPPANKPDGSVPSGRTGAPGRAPPAISFAGLRGTRARAPPRCPAGAC